MLLKFGYSNKTNNPNASPSRRMFGLLTLVGESGFEPLKSETTDLQSAPVGRLGILPNIRLLLRTIRKGLSEMELVNGLEPLTC